MQQVKCHWMSQILHGNLCHVQGMTDRRGQSGGSLAFVKPAHWNCCFEKSSAVLFICSELPSLHSGSVGSLVTDRKSAHWDGYQWKLFKVCAGACTMSHPSGLFPWQPLPPSICGCWQPSKRRSQSLKYHWQGQHPAGGKPQKPCVCFQRCGVRKAPL